MTEIVAYRYRYKDALTWGHSTTEPARHPNLIVEPLCVAEVWEPDSNDGEDCAYGKAVNQAERIAESLEALADVIMDSGQAGKLEAKLSMERAAKFIRRAGHDLPF